MKIYLDDTDAPNPADRDAARQIIEAILENDIFTKGSFVLEGYSAARRIAQALTLARRDERRRGFDVPYRMRKTKPALGATAVMAKFPGARPLYHWLEVDGVRLQSYRRGIHDVPLISDDGRIAVYEREQSWTAEVDGVLLMACALTCHFASAEDAVRAALAKIRG